MSPDREGVRVLWPPVGNQPIDFSGARVVSLFPEVTSCDVPCQKCHLLYGSIQLFKDNMFSDVRLELCECDAKERIFWVFFCWIFHLKLAVCVAVFPLRLGDFNFVTIISSSLVPLRGPRVQSVIQAVTVTPREDGLFVSDSMNPRGGAKRR